MPAVPRASLLALVPASLLAASVLSLPASAREPSFAFVGARLIPIAGPEIADGVLLIEGGRIKAVGPQGGVRVPKDATVVDLRGKVIMPGLVDTHSHVGGGWGADGSAPIQPDVRVLDSIDCRSAGFQRAQAGGLTTLNVMSGSGHLLSGQTLYLKTRDANTIEEMAIRDASGAVMGGIKMANGTNSQRDSPFPGTRSKSAALVREQFVKALAYRDKIAAARKDPKKAPERDLGMEALVEVLEGKRMVHHHTHRHDDILTVLRLQKEFGFRVVLHHVSEAWKVAAEIAAAGVACSVIVVDSPGGKLEAKDLSLETPGVLAKAGVAVSIHTDDWITDSRLFLRAAGLAVRAGMDRQAALEALTIQGARQLDLADRIGTLAAGKDADFIVLSGDPLSVWTRVEQTFVDGDNVFDLSREPDRLWATGGWGAGEPRAFTGCCFADGGDR
jgi:imidazolonepropionase-like amidohydrolase